MGLTPPLELAIPNLFKVDGKIGTEARSYLNYVSL